MRINERENPQLPCNEIIRHKLIKNMETLHEETFENISKRHK